MEPRGGHKISACANRVYQAVFQQRAKSGLGTRLVSVVPLVTVVSLVSVAPAVSKVHHWCL